jgi:hypothetical protein
MKNEKEFIKNITRRTVKKSLFWTSRKNRKNMNLHIPKIKTPKVHSYEIQISDTLLDQLAEKAASVKNYFQRIFKIEDKIQQESLKETKAIYDSDYALAKKYAWAVLAFQQSFKKAEILGSPGPGNGYFETVQLLFEQIEITCRKFLLLKECDREVFFPLIENYFPAMPRLTRCHYPSIFYFIASRMHDQNKVNPTKIEPDFWMVSVSPSSSLKQAAMILLAHSHNMFQLLRVGSEKMFKQAFPTYENAWYNFFLAFQNEHKENYCCWCPDLSINLLMERLSKDSSYAAKLKTVHRIANYFAVEPLRDCYENNLTHVIALRVLEIGSTTPDIMGGDFLRDVKILKLT